MSRVKKSLSGTQYLVTHTVGYASSGIRLDRFLMKRYRSRSREQLKRAIDAGAITILRNRAHLTNSPIKTKPSFALHHGDIVQVLSNRKPEPEVDFNYKILYEDEHLMVIDKPANLPVHPAGKYFFHTLLVHLKTKGFTAELESERKFFLVHRIDRETSGILLLAKTKKACAHLTNQFAKRQTEKYYLALVKGTPKENEFTVDAPIGKVRNSAIGLKMYAVPESEGGQTALTRFKTVSTRGDYSLLACYPKTGRQHQIRVHADHVGHPLVGDKIYGMSDEDAVKLIGAHRKKTQQGRSDASPDPIEEGIEDSDEEMISESMNDLLNDDEGGMPEMPPDDGEDASSDEPFEIPGPTSEVYAELYAKLILPRHALHAAGLKFTHPFTNQEIKFEAGLPDDLKEFFEKQGETPLLPDLFKGLF